LCLWRIILQLSCKICVSTIFQLAFARIDIFLGEKELTLYISLDYFCSDMMACSLKESSPLLICLQHLWIITIFITIICTYNIIWGFSDLSCRYKKLIYLLFAFSFEITVWFFTAFFMIWSMHRILWSMSAAWWNRLIKLWKDILSWEIISLKMAGSVQDALIIMWLVLIIKDLRNQIDMVMKI